MVEKFTNTERHFIDLLHDTINRMANNSANCKTWLLAIITAVVAYVALHPESVKLLLLIVIVDFVCYILDAYYLQLENNFRDLEADFVNKVLTCKDKNIVNDALYDFNFKKLEDNGVSIVKKNWIKALTSNATWIFYLVILLAVIIMYCVISGVEFHLCNCAHCLCK